MVVVGQANWFRKELLGGSTNKQFQQLLHQVYSQHKVQRLPQTRYVLINFKKCIIIQINSVHLLGRRILTIINKQSHHQYIRLIKSDDQPVLVQALPFRTFLFLRSLISLIRFQTIANKLIHHLIFMSEQPIAIKVVVVGDGSVGKTCLLISYTQDKFPTEYVPTVFDNYAATVKVDGRMVNLGLWDTAGQQEYNRLRPLAYPHCDVFLIVFSVIEPSSFINARKKWYPQLQENVGNVPKIFVGNKIDLRDEYAIIKRDPKEAPIMKQTARKLIEQEFQCKYMECSALTQDGLKNIFDESMRMVIQKKIKPMVVKKKKQSSCSLI